MKPFCLGENDVGEALEEVASVSNCPNPPIDHIAGHPKVGKKPETIVDALYKVGWRDPSLEEKQTFDENKRALSRLAWELENLKDPLHGYDEQLIEKVKRFRKLYLGDIQSPKTNRIFAPDEKPAAF